ncbi:MAG: thermonuclease family protein [Pseudomonadota bacterium]
MSRQSVEVAEVIDGDTLRLKGGVLLRMQGINTPEVENPHRRAERGGKAASRWLKNTLDGGERINIAFTGDTPKKDRYGRLLAHAFKGDTNLQAQLLTRGLGQSFSLDDDPLIRCYGNIERRARKSGSGLWAWPEYAPQSVGDALADGKGHKLVRAKVGETSLSRKNFWLHLEGGLGAKIERQHLDLFEGIDLTSLAGRIVTLRGFVFHSHNRWMLDLRHPNDLWLDDK